MNFILLEELNLDKVKEILISEEEITQKVKELGAKITKDYAGKPLLCVCILKGSILFTADLIREINLPLEIDFMAVSSYGSSTESSGIVRILKDLDKSVEGQNVLIIEDIIDSGLTLQYLLKNLNNRKAESVKVCTFLDKKERRVVDIVPDYSGYVIPDKFVVGYGLDFAGKYRNLKYVGIYNE